MIESRGVPGVKSTCLHLGQVISRRITPMTGTRGIEDTTEVPNTASIRTREKHREQSQRPSVFINEKATRDVVGRW